MANISIGNPYVYHQLINRRDGGSKKYGAFLTVELVSQDQVSNTSTVKLSFSLGCPGSGAQWTGYSDAHAATIQLGYNPNSTTYSYNEARKIKSFYATGSNTDVNKSTVLSTWQVVIKHNSSGEGYLQAEYIWDNRNTKGWDPVDSTGYTERVNLPQINSATKISVSPLVLESGNETITAKAFNNTNLTTVQYSLDNSTWTTLVNKQAATGTAHIVTVPPIAYNTLKPLIGTKTTATVYVRAMTWLADGTTRVGTTQTTSFTVQTGVIPQSWYDDLNGGVGVTLGKKATGEGFVIADAINPWDCYVNGKPWVNFVTEEHRETATGLDSVTGPMEDNCWRLWYDGTIEMWGAKNVARGTNTPVTWPYTLAACPVIQCTPVSGAAQVILASAINITTTGADLHMYRGTNTTNTIMYYARGKVA